MHRISNFSTADLHDQGMPISSVHHECFKFRRCDTTAVQCGLETVLVSFVLSTRSCP